MGRTILITGASSGIGLALARQLAGNTSDRLVLIGRRPLADQSDSFFTEDTYCQADLSVDGAAETIDGWLEAHNIQSVDVLINNAGVGWSGPLWSQPAASVCELVAVNVVAPIELTQRLMPRLRAASGTVVFVSSVVASVASPDFGVYVASKKALDGFVRSVRAELVKGQPQKVRFQVAHPGATRTELPVKVGIPEATYQKWPSADSVASRIIEELEGSRSSYDIGLPNRVLGVVSRKVPGLVARMASRRRETLPTLTVPHVETKRVLITGAADGIGRALALRYASAGYQVTGVDIDRQRSAQTMALAPGGGIAFRHVDLASSDMAWVSDEEPFDVVVQNAGISAVGRFETIDPADHRRVIRLNFLAPMLLARALLVERKLNQRSRMVFVSSLSHQLSYPGAAVYAATKDGVEMYARAFRSAMHPMVTTTTVFPGPVRTAHARRYSPDNADESRRMPPEVLAEHIFGHTSSRLLPGAVAKLSATVGTVAPAVGELVMRRTVYEKLLEGGNHPNDDDELG